MATYVLVHGAWGGAHGFHLLRPRLRAAGHEVFTPSLTGIGERSHLTGPHVGLGLHVRDVVNTVLYEDLRDIVLLGFSYGGMVVTGALDEIGDRVRELVYLDAFLPADGQSAVDLAPAMAALVPPAALDAPWLIPGRDRHYDDPAEARWSAPRRCEQPVATFTEPVRTAVPVDQRPLGRTYVRATAEDVTGGAFTAAAAHAKSSPAWRYHEIETTHMVPQNRPEDLATILLDLVGGPRPPR